MRNLKSLQLESSKQNRNNLVGEEEEQEQEGEEKKKELKAQKKNILQRVGEWPPILSRPPLMFLSTGCRPGLELGTTWRSWSKPNAYPNRPPLQMSSWRNSMLV
jgi:hypothetical protein